MFRPSATQEVPSHRWHTEGLPKEVLGVGDLYRLGH